MNEDIFTGQWKQMRGSLKSWWGKLSDDDFEEIGGQKDKLIGLIQERYGRTLEQARNEVEQRFNEYGGSEGSRVSGSGSAIVVDKVREATAEVTNALEKTGSYLKEKDVTNIAADLAGVFRKYPVQSVLIGAALIYLLSRNSNR